ncbi:MAG TPA: hypothetical protein VFG69_01570, partial [Nannocystaceae bacterium]|nr:hypothetical protein [Nannocystaceae bacterium]
MPTSQMHSKRGGSRAIASVSWVCVVPLFVAPGCFFAHDDGDPSGDADDGDGPYPEPEPQPEPLQEEPFSGPCIADGWIDDADADAGVPVSFDLAGTEVGVVADTAMQIEAVPAPFAIAPSPNGGEPLVVFEDATIDGEPAGTVVVTGAVLQVETGVLAEPAVAAASFGEQTVGVTLVAADDDGTRPDLGATADPTHVEALANAEPVDVRFDAARIAAYTAAYVVTPEGNLPLAGAFDVSAARVWWPHGTAIEAAAIDARFGGDVFIGLAANAGTFADGSGTELPIAILGRDAHLRVGPTRVQTIEDMPVHQAMGREEILLSSDVELRMCQADTLVFYAGQTRKLRFAYRQPDGLTDAVFANVVV